jgi:hypothetical protein
MLWPAAHRLLTIMISTCSLHDSEKGQPGACAKIKKKDVFGLLYCLQSLVKCFHILCNFIQFGGHVSRTPCAAMNFGLGHGSRCPVPNVKCMTSGPNLPRRCKKGRIFEKICLVCRIFGSVMPNFVGCRSAESVFWVTGHNLCRIEQNCTVFWIQSAWTICSPQIFIWVPKSPKNCLVMWAFHAENTDASAWIILFPSVITQFWGDRILVREIWPDLDAEAIGMATSKQASWCGYNTKSTFEDEQHRYQVNIYWEILSK